MRWLLFALLLAPAAAEPPTARSFFRDFYAAHERELAARLAADWRALVDHGLPDTSTNRARFQQALFVYHLVRRDAVLGNAFLIRDDDGRHPDTMLRDAFSEKPRYRLDYQRGWFGAAARADEGEVYSFGRCDEFEMLQTALAKKVFALPARVAMLMPDHVVTEIEVEGGFLRLDASLLTCVAFSKKAIADAPPADGKYRVARTNQLALRDFHENRPLPAAGIARVVDALNAFLAEREAPPVYCRRPSM